jgi:Flp pilus assembly protein TadG
MRAINSNAWLPRATSFERLIGDRRGVSAIEFAMLAPVVILLYVGIAELGNAMTMYRRVANVASTAADLTAQVKTVATADLQDIASASSSILAPYSTTPLKIVVSSVVADQNNNGKVAWSYANKGAGRAANSRYAVPVGLTEPGSSVIVSEVTYAFTPLVDLQSVFSPGSFDMTRTFYARPRRSLTVTKSD